MAIGGLHHINVRTTAAKLEETRRFYEDILEMTVGARPPFRGAGYWMYAAGHPWVHISVDEAADAAGPGAGFGHIAFAARDAAALRRRLGMRGIAWDERPTPDDAALQIFCRDPNGVMIECVFPVAEAAADAAE